ncbi:probable receptor-like protein kinase At1g49730 [Cynara cardunculus var. scolymus]|uniref:Protein kinase, catalytic domain-containing protein n=1 Tax=Cynara cardunculus var. scolymus TaxID=59895 RepID=A0A118JXA9_CYNCS|nr:probable receptor-like protein kinase At1g49730 [Cynara cardunculus var. scolymus]KVH96654.1 Protein kinase, catalytic domain-containing protein [Cynara cardunculus var. scolymus]
MNDGLMFRIRLLLQSRSVPVIFLRRFSYKDIKRATDSFSRVITTSSHGASYKARFQGGHVAVVKEIHLIGQEDDHIFYREVQLLGRLHHRHVVALNGYSVGQKRFLVFENVENGSLKEHLNDPLRTPLDWRIRLKIAVGVAAALEYLHFFCDPPVYHVSISSNTIMLDENFDAKLSDVGLLGSGSDQVTAWRTSSSNETTGQAYGNIMYQLGLLILELITGQSSEKTGDDLVEWIEESCFPASMDNMIDPDLGNDYDSRELTGLLAVARFCLKSVDKPNSFTPQIYRYLQRKISIRKTPI